MSDISNEIMRVQDALKQIYSIDKYNNIIKKLKAETNNDPEVLAHMSEDMQLCLDERMFAVAEMGE